VSFVKYIKKGLVLTAFFRFQRAKWGCKIAKVLAAFFKFQGAKWGCKFPHLLANFSKVELAIVELRFKLLKRMLPQLKRF